MKEIQTQIVINNIKTQEEVYNFSLISAAGHIILNHVYLYTDFLKMKLHTLLFNLHYITTESNVTLAFSYLKLWTLNVCIIFWLLYAVLSHHKTFNTEFATSWCWIFDCVTGQGWASSSSRWYHRGHIPPSSAPFHIHTSSHTAQSHALAHCTRTHIHARWISAQPWLPGRCSKRLLSERIKSPLLSSALLRLLVFLLTSLASARVFQYFIQDSCAVFFYMATSDGLDGCLQRGRSQSDPNILTEPGIDLSHGTGRMNVALRWFFFFFFIAFILCSFIIL